MAETAPLPVLDLVGFGLLVAALLLVHAARLRIRSHDEIDASGEPASASPLLVLASRSYQAGAWVAAWHGLALAGRVIGFL